MELEVAFNSDGVTPGGVSERLWRDTSAYWAQALHHPFVAGLANGTLSK
jgi:thiaminase